MGISRQRIEDIQAMGRLSVLLLLVVCLVAPTVLGIQIRKSSGLEDAQHFRERLAAVQKLAETTTEESSAAAVDPTVNVVSHTLVVVHGCQQAVHWEVVGLTV